MCRSKKRRYSMRVKEVRDRYERPCDKSMGIVTLIGIAEQCWSEKIVHKHLHFLPFTKARQGDHGGRRLRVQMGPRIMREQDRAAAVVKEYTKARTAAACCSRGQVRHGQIGTGRNNWHHKNTTAELEVVGD